MLEDGNPAELFEAKGEALWKQKRGPKNASLEACDLGKGPGVVKGAWVEMPRYFADTEARAGPRVAPADLHGNAAGLQRRRDRQDAVRPRRAGQHRRRWRRGSPPRRAAMKLATCRKAHAEERRVYELGKRAFFFRGGPYDFSCASCHGEDGQTHPPAGPAEPDQEPRRRRRLRVVAGLPRQQRRAVDHAAASERLLPPAAFPVPRLSRPT